MIPNKIDHIIITSADLNSGMDYIEERIGIRPIIGGQHPKWGTHNALLSLGDSYLEVVSPHPELSKKVDKTWIDPFLSSGPQLSSWVLQTSEIELYRENGIKVGIELGEIENGQRQKPDGDLLKWSLTDPYTMPENGTLPFLIDWATTPHPSQSAPIAGQLTELVIEHPTPAQIEKGLKALDIELKVIQANRPGLKALIKRENDLIELR